MVVKVCENSGSNWKPDDFWISYKSHGFATSRTILAPKRTFFLYQFFHFFFKKNHAVLFVSQPRQLLVKSFHNHPSAISELAKHVRPAELRSLWERETRHGPGGRAGLDWIKGCQGIKGKQGNQNGLSEWDSSWETNDQLGPTQDGETCIQQPLSASHCWHFLHRHLQSMFNDLCDRYPNLNLEIGGGWHSNAHCRTSKGKGIPSYEIGIRSQWLAADQLVGSTFGSAAFGDRNHSLWPSLREGTSGQCGSSSSCWMFGPWPVQHQTWAELFCGEIQSAINSILLILCN